MEKKEQQLKDLILKFEGIAKRIEAIPEEIITMEKRAEERQRDLDQILRNIEKTREERQRLLVSGGRVEPVSRKIKDLWESCDLIEDEILGLKGKVRDLQGENDKILVDKDLCRDEIIRAKVSPLLEAYNMEAEKLSDILKGVLSLMDEYNLPFGEPNGWGRFISCSSWIGLRIIPRLSRACDKPGEDFFNVTEIFIKRQREQREQAYKLASAPGTEAR